MPIHHIYRGALTLIILVLYSTGYARHQIRNLDNTNVFVENKGQIIGTDGELANEVLFMAKFKQFKVFLSGSKLSYQFENQVEGSIVDSVLTRLCRLDVDLVGANPSPRVMTFGASEYFENYYLAHCPEGITKVKSYQRIIFKDIYPKIDWEFVQYEGSIKYNFIVNPGGDVDQIKLEYGGADRIKLSENGSIELLTAGGVLVENKPKSFIGNLEIASRFDVTGNQVGFILGSYCPNDTLLIDPILEWKIEYGSYGDFGTDVATDHSGNVYHTGRARSATAIASGGHQNTLASTEDAYLVKFDENGNRLWATYYGGLGDDLGTRVCVDDINNVILCGTTKSINAIANNGHDNTYNGGQDDAFLAKFDSNGVREWGTYYGSNLSDQGLSCHSDGTNVYLTTVSGGNACIAKYSSTGALLWNDCIAGTLYYKKFGYDCSTDNQGNVYFATTWSSQQYNDEGHLYKYDSLGTLQWTKSLISGSTFLIGCVSDDTGNVYIVGSTSALSGISTSGSHQQTFGGDRDAFVIKYDTAGNKLWGTYLGGGNDDQAGDCALDSQGNLYISGRTSSKTDIAFNGWQVSKRGISDALLAKFTSSGSLLWSTYYGEPLKNLSAYCATSIDHSVYISGGFNQHSWLSKAFLVKYDGCKPSGVISDTACYSYQWSVDNQVYQQSGNYQKVVSTSGGCDSAIVLSLTVNDTTYGSTSITTCNNYFWPSSGVTYKSSGNYSVTLVGSNGCDSIFSLDLTLIDTFGVSTIIACDSFFWSLDSNTYFQSGVYYDTIQSSLGCDSVVSLDLTVESPDTLISYSNGKLVSGDSNASYQWYLCTPTLIKITGATTQILLPPANAQYAVVVSKNGCSDTSRCVSVEDIGSPDYASNQEFVYFPNPVTDQISLVFGRMNSMIKVEILDLSGRVVLKEAYHEARMANLSLNFEDGVYIVRVSSDEGLDTSFKIFKKQL